MGRIGSVKRKDAGKMGEAVFTATAGEVTMDKTMVWGGEQQKETGGKAAWSGAWHSFPSRDTVSRLGT